MGKKIVVLHICARDFGGAGSAALRLHSGLKQCGVNSQMLVLYSQCPQQGVSQFTQNGQNIFQRWGSKFRQKIISAQLNSYKRAPLWRIDDFRDDRTAHKISGHPLVKQADIIHLHWITEMVDHRDFFLGVKDKPIVWTMHDMNPFTGGCHYSGDCIRYTQGCGCCPQLNSENPNDLSSRIFRRKEKAYQGRKIRLVCPSRWLADCAKKSKLFRNSSIQVIANGICPALFRKHNQQNARQQLNLPQDKTLILFAAHYNTQRKGLKYLIQALKMIKGVTPDRLALVIFGNCQDGYFNDSKFTIYPLGQIKEQGLLTYAYSAVDLFAIPSLEDNLPNTLLESFACSLAVVGFNSGGITELIQHQRNGLLAERGNAHDLAEKISWLATHPLQRQAMGESARKLIEQKFTLEIQAQHYLKIYDSLVRS